MLDSEYESQLAQPYWGLRFTGELERGFRAYYRGYLRNHLRLASVALAVMVALASLTNHVFFDLPEALSWQFDMLMLGLLAPSMLILFYLLGRPGWTTLMSPMSIAVAVLGTGFFLLLEIRYAAAGVAYPFESFLFVCAYLFLLSGLRFRPALALALMVFAVTLWLRLSLGGGWATVGESAYNLLAIIVICGAGGYMQEFTARTNFLHQNIAAFNVSHDPLTGLNNRRGFNDLYALVWRQAIRDSADLAVMVVDIDHFKRFNDNFGHAAGDQALASVARTFQQVSGSRPLDFCARLGGEEFAVVMYAPGKGNAKVFAEKIRQAVEQTRIDGGPADGESVTVSVGLVTVRPVPGVHPEAVLQRADQLLYLAKQAGRNVVRAADINEESQGDSEAQQSASTQASQA